MNIIIKKLFLKDIKKIYNANLNEQIKQLLATI